MDQDQDLDAEGPMELELTRPGNNIVDIDEYDSNDSAEEKEPKPEEEVDIAIIIEKLEKNGKRQFTSRPFHNGDMVCFRPDKTSKWLKGKIQMIIHSDKDISFIISEDLENGQFGQRHEVPDRRELIKSNKLSPGVLNSLDHPARKGKATFRRAAVPAADTHEKETEEKTERDPLTKPMIRVNQILRSSLSGDRISSVDQLTPTLVRGRHQRDVNQNKESHTNIDLVGRIQEMFKDHQLESTDTEDQGTEEVERMLKSLSKQQIQSLVVHVAEDFVKFSSEESSYKVM